MNSAFLRHRFRLPSGGEGVAIEISAIRTLPHLHSPLRTDRGCVMRVSFSVACANLPGVSQAGRPCCRIRKRWARSTWALFGLCHNHLSGRGTTHSCRCFCAGAIVTSVQCSDNFVLLALVQPLTAFDHPPCMRHVSFRVRASSQRFTRYRCTH